MSIARPFRFGIQGWGPESRDAWAESARKAEAFGYAILSIPDHFTPGRISYGPALMAVANATTTLRIGPFVLDNDFRHPALVADEAATLDLLSDGRFELGLGAGWMREDYERSGIPWDNPATRVGRLEESVQIIKGMLGGEPVIFKGQHYSVTDMQIATKPVQQPHPPLLIGGGGKRMLALAACEADIISITPLALREGGISLAIEDESYQRQIQYIRDQAGDRFQSLELNVLIQRVGITDDPKALATEISKEWAKPVEAIRNSPLFLVGTTEEIIDTLRKRREQFGISYITTRMNDLETFAPVVKALAGT